MYPKYHKLVPDGGFIKCAKDIYRLNGAMGFWKGFASAGSRGVLVGAVELSVYEYSSVALTKYRAIHKD